MNQLIAHEDKKLSKLNEPTKNKLTVKEIISLLPYQEPFLFVDEITEVSDDGITGNYTFREDAFFYKGHFKNHPVTPGVILTEAMAQIGVVCLGIYLMRDNLSSIEGPGIALSSNQIDFYLPVMPGEEVKVVSKKEYFRFNKLKCKVSLYNSREELVCRGSISGMIKATNI
jgi:3-hydroxyacyl-[acyl-carrier-protein] dehydratase